MSERTLSKLADEMLIFSPVKSRKILLAWINACHDSLANAVYIERQVLPFAAEHILKSDLPMLLRLLNSADDLPANATSTTISSPLNVGLESDVNVCASMCPDKRTKLLPGCRTVSDAHSDSNVLAVLLAIKYLVKKSGVQSTFLKCSYNDKCRTVLKDLLTLCFELQVYGNVKCLLQKTFLAPETPATDCEDSCTLEGNLVQNVRAAVFLLFYQFSMDNTRIANVFQLSMQHNYLSFCTFLDIVKDRYEEVPVSLESVSDHITAWIFLHRLLESGSTELTPSIIQTLSISHWSFLSICRKSGQYPAVYKQYLDLYHQMTDNFLRDSVFKSVCTDGRLHDYFLDTMLSSFPVAATCTCGMPLPTADISWSWHNSDLMLDVLDMTVHCSYWLERCWTTGFWPGYLMIAKKLGRNTEVMKILLQLGNLMLLDARIRYGYALTSDEDWRDLFALKSQQLRSEPFNSTENPFNSETTKLANRKRIYCLICKEPILISEETLCCEDSWPSEHLSNPVSKTSHGDTSVPLTGKFVHPVMNPYPGASSDACFQGRQLCFSWNHLVTLCVKEIGVVRTLTVLKDVDLPSKLLGSDFFHLCLQEIAVHQQQGPLVRKLLEELSEQLWVVPSSSNLGSLLMQTSDGSYHAGGGVGVKINVSQPCHVCFYSLSRGSGSSIFFSCGHGFHRSCLPDGFYCLVCFEH